MPLQAKQHAPYMILSVRPMRLQVQHANGSLDSKGIIPWQHVGNGTKAADPFPEVCLTCTQGGHRKCIAERAHTRVRHYRPLPTVMPKSCKRSTL